MRNACGLELEKRGSNSFLHSKHVSRAILGMLKMCSLVTAAMRYR